MPRLLPLMPLAGLLLFAALVSSLAGLGGTTDRSETVDATTWDVALAVVAPTPRIGAAEPYVAPAGDDGIAETAAAAATTGRDPGWLAPVKLKGAGGNVTKCGSTWSGGSDGDGLVYHACGTKLHVRGNKGALRDVVDPNETAPVGRRDVAPHPSGNVIYYTVGDRVDTGMTAAQLKSGWGSVHRMRRNAKGVWSRDTNWSAGPFKLYGGAPWSARYLTVGADGVVYMSVNAFVFAFDHAGRTRGDEFGQYDAAGTRIGGPIAGYDAVGAAPGFNVVEGLATSADGQYLYAIEEDYDFVARFVRNAQGAWTPDRIAGTPNDFACGSPTKLAAPYDVATSKAGEVYVANTTCGEIRRYDSALTYSGTVLTIATLPHGLAMAGNGAIILPWRNEIYARS